MKALTLQLFSLSSTILMPQSRNAKYKLNSIQNTVLKLVYENSHDLMVQELLA